MAREIAFLTNPTSDRGKGARYGATAAARLRDSGLVVRDLQGRDADEAQDLARAAVGDGVDALVVCGGDGLVHLATQVLARSGVPLGIIPAGSGNDVARYVGLPRNDPVAAADRVIASRLRTIDLARSGSRFYVTVLAAGFDAVVNERANNMVWPRGQMRYTVATMAELRTFRPLPFTIDLDGTPLQLEAMLVAVGNGPSYGGGLRITEGALLDDGLLDVVIIKEMTRTKLIRTYPKLFLGTHVGEAEYVHHRARSITLAAPGVVSYADGERFGELPLTITCEPGALAVYA